MQTRFGSLMARLAGRQVRQTKQCVHFRTAWADWTIDGGTDYGAAKAGTDNAEQYYKTAVCGMLAWDVDVFYFEAFDESWKPDSIGDNGQPMDEGHWGMFTDNRKKKFDTSCPHN